LGQTSHVIDEYGESFAEVYDRWYPRHEVATSVTAALVPSGGRRLLELGVGTGALAIPLATAGWDVTGVDASPSMLAVLEGKLNEEKLPAEQRGLVVTATLGDAADPSTWPAGRYDVVLAAWNLVTNLADRAAQAAMFRGAADVLAPDGRVVVESFVPAPPPRRERRVAIGSAEGSTVVHIHTDADPSTSTVVGRHVELAGGTRTDPPRVAVRTWRLCWISPLELDELAGATGLELVARHEDWSGTPFAPSDSSQHVSWYRRHV
jgi:SAM-dependent methyltransferase